MSRGFVIVTLLAVPLVAACNGPATDRPADGGSPVADAGDPGRVTLHRLNRVEYDNTVRDLTGTALRPAGAFPTDDLGYGFDNVADVLSVSPLHVEAWSAAAKALVDDVLYPGPEPMMLHVEAEQMRGSTGLPVTGFWNLSFNGTLVTETVVPAGGRYLLRARAWAQQAGPELARMSLQVSGGEAVIVEVDAATLAATEVYEVEVVLFTGGPKTVDLGFVNEFQDPATGRDRILKIDWFELEGPTDLPPYDTTRRDRVLLCTPAAGAEQACARQIFTAFLRRAYRRPATTEDVAGLVALVDLALTEGDDFETGIRLGLQAALTSPHFLYRVEVDADPAAHPLSPHELASRLSYFLWSSMPDEELFAAADEGRLGTTAELRAQAERMLDDPRAAALTDNFAGQWLQTRALAHSEPDYDLFASYWFDELEEAFAIETRMLFEDVLLHDEPVETLLLADYTFVDERLARHYGLPSTGSVGFRRIALGDSPRRGVLGHGSVLTVTSHRKRTSPVKRGKWVLTQLLCDEPEPPPPGVEALLEETTPSGTLRQQLEEHRENPFCASCHEAMDPLGFGLERLNPIGAYRDTDRGFPIDSAGLLPDGQSFDGAVELATILAGDERFYACLAEKMYVYALGRGPEDEGAAHVTGITAAYRARGGTLRELIFAVVESGAFRSRRGELEDLP